MKTPRPEPRFKLGQIVYLWDSHTMFGKPRKHPLLRETCMVVGNEWSRAMNGYDVRVVCFGKHFYGARGADHNPYGLTYHETSFHSVPPSKDMKWVDKVGWTRKVGQFTEVV